MALQAQIMEGLMSDPKYLPSCMEWGTDEADALFQSRKKAPGYDVNEEVPLITSAFTKIAESFDSSMIIVEIGAGVSNKTVTLLEILMTKEDREIVYIPVDLDPGILSLPQSLNATLKRPITVIPLLKDSLEALSDIENVRNEKKWPILFALFGPTTIVLPFDYTKELFKRVSDILNDGQNAGLMFTYRMDVDKAEGMTMACFTQSILPNYETRYMNLFLNQLAEMEGCSVDAASFTPAVGFRRQVPVLGRSTVDAFCFYAESTKDQTFTFRDRAIHLRAGERICLFTGCGLRLHFSDGLVRSLAADNQLTVQGTWSTDTLALALLNSS